MAANAARPSRRGVKRQPRAHPQVGALSAALDDRLPVVSAPRGDASVIEMVAGLRPTLLWFENRAGAIIDALVPWPQEESLPHPALETYPSVVLLDAAEGLCANLFRLCGALGLPPTPLSATAVVHAAALPYPPPPGEHRRFPLFRLWWEDVRTTRFVPGRTRLVRVVNRACQELLCARLADRLWVELLARWAERPALHTLGLMWAYRTPGPRARDVLMATVSRAYQAGARQRRPPIASWSREPDPTGDVVLEASAAIKTLRKKYPLGTPAVRVWADGAFDALIAQLGRTFRDRSHRASSRRTKRAGRAQVGATLGQIHVLIPPPDRALERKEARGVSDARAQAHLTGLCSTTPGAAALAAILTDNPGISNRKAVRLLGWGPTKYYQDLRGLAHAAGLPADIDPREFLRRLAEWEPDEPEDRQAARRTGPRGAEPDGEDVYEPPNRTAALTRSERKALSTGRHRLPGDSPES